MVHKVVGAGRNEQSLSNMKTQYENTGTHHIHDYIVADLTLENKCQDVIEQEMNSMRFSWNVASVKHTP